MTANKLSHRMSGTNSDLKLERRSMPLIGARERWN